MRFELRDSEAQLWHAVRVGRVSLDATSHTTPATANSAGVLDSEWLLAVRFAVSTFDARDALGATLIAQQRWADPFAAFNGPLPLPPRLAAREAHAARPRHHSAPLLDDHHDRDAGGQILPDLLSARVDLALSSLAPLSTPMGIDVAVQASPLRLFLERGSLQTLADYVTSAVARPSARFAVLNAFASCQPCRRRSRANR